MALRNYLYAKHAGDAYTATLINKSTSAESSATPITKFPRKHHPRIHNHKHKAIIKNTLVNSAGKPDAEACGSGREVVMEDGSKKCNNCVDCPKKVGSPEDQITSEDNSVPKVGVEVSLSAEESTPSIGDVQTNVQHLYLNDDVANETLPKEIDFTNVL
ncbi:hypothetical protein HYPBUDRAFT_6571 [Hyphopichia burtonii NRRL Y-1933]|uniref:Uncharacterized protein n=1 Tax=Hyphopichia burtonii NRRL Y-1933 TaxID=984485 RepID=A0A1E4RJ67_9ASCO|nr:hypothetical protein HYPBUDRAFT_6571 [Hyphopichia burtonii NRRL Y-1933]ODV67293.1 hypothetical protein HYPBUDRAFT_6571 [Hyphopichia burtonii NRRL Y-1933]